jgi:hypothetical protein
VFVRWRLTRRNGILRVFTLTAFKNNLRRQWNSPGMQSRLRTLIARSQKTSAISPNKLSEKHLRRVEKDCPIRDRNGFPWFAILVL